MSTLLRLPATLQFVPPEDGWEFVAIRATARDRAAQLFAIAQSVHAAPKNQRTTTYQRCAAELGCSFNTLYAPISQFLKSRDWRCLIDRRLAGSDFWLTKNNHGLPADFLRFWRGLVLDNQRAAKAPYDALMLQLKRWRAGDATAAIPGFITPPLNAKGCKHPQKMSYRDLLRVKPSDIEETAARNGRSAAMKLLPAIFTTRKGGWACMEYQFDDMYHDFDVIHNMQICRLLEFNAIEYYSGFVFNPGLRPRIQIASSKHQELNEREFRLYAINFLATYGWSPRGTTLQAERGTAAFRWLAPKLVHWSGGLLKVPLPGMSGAPAIVGGYSERAKGNPNAKALKEGMGKIIHNRLASLPGQLGMNPDDKPSSSFGRDKEARDLLALQQHLSQPLHLTHLTFDQAAYEVVSAYMEINRRTEHAMEGWIEEGLYTQEYLADPYNDTWIDLSTLPDVNRQALRIIAQANPHSLRPRKLSPHEVISPALEHNIRLSPEAEADCLYEDARRSVTVTAGHLAFEDKDCFGPGTFRYIAEYQDRCGFNRTLPNDSQIQLVINPFNPERGFLFTLQAAYLGIVKRDHSIQRADRDAIQRKIGQKERIFKDHMLAASVHTGLKREHQLTDNARIIRDEFRFPAATPPAPAAGAYDTAADYAAAELVTQPDHHHVDASILL